MATWNQNIGIANWANRTNQIPTSFDILNVSSLNVNNISAGQINVSSIYTNFISVGQISVSSFTNLPSTLNASNWAYYAALSTVRGEKDILGNPQYNIQDFQTITSRYLHAAISGFPIPAGGVITADYSVDTPLVNTTKIECSNTLQTAEINLYGKNLIAGDNSLYVEGGVSLSGAGLIHGVHIGTLPVGGFDTQRIDVNPIGIDIVGPTFITIDAGGAANLAAGGALSLAGGDYIEYNTDENRFINTTFGNDNTTIYVGNINGAYDGSRPLKINDNRGVEISNATKIILNDEIVNPWNGSNLYVLNDTVNYLNVNYAARLLNRNQIPNGTIQKFSTNITYYLGEFVSSSQTWQCSSTITSTYNTTPPFIGDGVWLSIPYVSTVNKIWTQISSFSNSYIAGNENSYARLGGVSTLNISSFEITANNIYTYNLGNPNPFVPTSINVNNSMNFLNNSISNVDTLSASNLIIENEVAVSSLSTFAITTTGITIKSTDTTQGGILFLDSNNNPVAGLSDQYGDFLFQTTSNYTSIVNGFNNNIIYGNYSNTSLNEMTLIGVSTINVGSFSTINLQSEVINLNAGLGVSISSIIFAPSSFTNTIQGNGKKIDFNSNNLLNINGISTNYVSSFVLTANQVYTTYLGNPDPLLPILVNQPLDLQGNNMSNIRLLTTSNISTINISSSLIRTNNLITNNLTTSNISTINISSSLITANIVNVSSFVSTNFVQANNIGVRSNIVVNRIDGSFCQFSQFAGGILGVNFINSFTSNGVVFVSSNLSSVNLRVSTITANNIFNAGFLSTATIQTSGSINVGPTGNGTVNAGQVNAPATGIVNLPNIQPVQSVNTCGRLTQTWGGGYFVSTFTDTIIPVSGINSITSTVSIRGTLSTLNQTVSSINRKLFPFFSTLSVPASTFAINGTSANTPIVLYSNIPFPNMGLFKLTQKAILSKNSGGTSADLHGNIFYTQGTFPSTFSLLDGYSALPTVNQDGVSSFTTLNTNVLISSITTRNILYYDATANNYTARLYMGNVVAEYVPPFGFNVDSGSNPAF